MDEEKLKRLDSLLQDLLEKNLNKESSSKAPQAERPAGGGNVIRRRKGHPDKRIGS